MFYPLLQFSFFRSFFFREVSVNDDIAVKLIVFCSRKCLREEIDSRDTFNIFLLNPYWSQKKRILYTPFFWHSIGWVEIFYLFIFIWEVRIRHWSRNPSQKFSWRFDEAKSKSMYRRIMKRNSNRCIVALMKRNPNRSSHFDEAKFKTIVALWLSEIQIDVSSHFDEAKSKSMYRRIVMKRNPNRSSHFDEAKFKSIVAFWWTEIQIDRRILMAFIFREVEVHWIVMNLVIVISEVPWWKN